MVVNIWDRYVEENARRFGVPPALVQSVISAESGGRADAQGPVTRSGQRAGGYMQVMPNTYAELRQKHGLGEDRFDPANNIAGGTAYLAQLYEQFGNWPDAVAAYNAGPGRWAKVKAGQATVPAETAAYVPKVMGPLGEQDVAMRPTPQAVQEGGNMAGPDLSFGAARGHRPSLTGLLEVDENKNWYDGLGGLWNVGQTPSEPPRPEGPVEQLPSQTERLDVAGRMNELMQGLLKPPARGPQMTPGQYMLAGAGEAVGRLAGVHDRKVGFGELLGALGGGLARGTAAGEQAQQERLGSEFDRLGKFATLQNQRRTADLNEQNAVYDNRYKQALTQKALRPDVVEPKVVGNGVYENGVWKPAPWDAPRSSAQPPPPVTLGNGPEGPGVYARNPDGTLGPRLGASETGQDVDAPQATLTPEQAQQQGLPPPPANSPYANPNLSSRGRSNLVSAQQKGWEKRAADNDEAVKSATAVITDMERFKYLNSQTETGGVGGHPIGSAVRSLYDNNVKEMNSITARITPTLRQPGSGATSDFDARMFREGTVGVDKDKAVNDNIATAAIEAAKNQIAKAQFEQAYFDAYQHTGGMEAAWQKYLNDNPIFDPKADAGSYKLNPRENRQTWQDYFRNGMKVPDRAPEQSAGGQGGGDAQQQPSAGQGQQTQQAPAVPLPPESARVPGQAYMTGRGPAIWRGTGWELVERPAGAGTGAPGQGITIPVR